MGPINRPGPSTAPTLECAPTIGSIGTGVTTRRAPFDYPAGIALAPNPAGSLLVANTMCVRRVTPDGEAWTVTTRDFWIEAHGDREFGFLGGIAVDNNGDILLTDISLHALLIVDRNGQVSVLAGGNGAGFSDGWGRSERFDKPRGLAVDASGRIFIADSNNQAVRVLYLYVSDQFNNCVHRALV